MDILSWEFAMALLTIIFIDLILAGDNAIVIGMAARNLQPKHQKQAIIWGTFGAVAIRILATLAVVWLLKVPWLMLGGGLLLLWIAYKLLVPEDDHNIEAKDNLFAAIRTIVIADAAMGIDNVIAIAGAAEGQDHHNLLVILGLLISIPVVVWGSTLIIKLINRYPWVIYFGAGVLAYTAAKMITGERELKFIFEGHTVIKYTFDAVVVLAVLLAGKATADRKAKQSKALEG